MSNKKKYWKNLSELSSEKVTGIDDIKQREFVEEIPVDEFLGDKENL